MSLRIFTNMAFWQSETWRQATHSIYPLTKDGCDDNAMSPWREAVTLWKRSRDFDVVVVMGARESLAYGLLCLLTGRPSRMVMTEVFIDDARAMNPFWQLKTLAYHIVAKRSIGVLTNSTTEVENIAGRFRLPHGMLRYVPMHTNILHPALSQSDEGFILSAGFTRRDYGTLIRAAPSIQAPIEIICSRDEILPSPLPPNVKVHREVSRDTYLDYVQRCSVVVLPLHPTERATGQVVLLEAMAFGKPVVASRAPGVIDHIRQGKTGFIVDPGNSNALVKAVNGLIEHPDERRRLGAQALADVLALNTVETHAQNKLKAVEELWQL